MTMIHPFNPQYLSKQLSCHVRRVYSGFLEEGVMSPLDGYGCSSEAETNLIKYLGGGSDSEEDHLMLVVAHPMADQEDDSRTTDQSVNEATTASTSLIKDATTHPYHHQEGSNNMIDRGDKWLQLSIGGGLTAAADDKHDLDIQSDDNQSSTRGRGARHRMIELDLLPGSTAITNLEQELKLKSSTGLAASTSMFQVPGFGAPPGLLPNIITSSGAAAISSSPSSSYYPSNISLFMQQYPENIYSFPSSQPHPHHGEIEFNWGALRPVPPRNIGSFSTPLCSSSSSRLVATAGPYFTRPSQLQYGLGVGEPRHGIDFRVVAPPGRPTSGIWFMLQASQNQAKEPILPQIPKSFLRIKDGRMTIRIVMKYLVNKLKLENESEVEIKCRGQRIVPMLTLQHVRDGIWRNTNTAHSLASPTTDHIMLLHYGRSL